MSQFTWKPFFAEMFTSICENDNKYSLAEKAKKIFDLKVRTDASSEPEPVEQIDPFTFIARFNQGKRTQENKKKECLDAKTIFGLTSDVPANFDGIPTFDNRNFWFYSYKNAQKDIDLIWDFSLKLHRDKDVDGVLFDEILKIKGVALGKLSQMLYLCAPERFYPADKRSKYKLSPTLKAEDSYTYYRKYITEIKEKFPDLLPYEYSAQAFAEFDHVQKKPKNSTPAHARVIREDTPIAAKTETVTEPLNQILFGPPGTGKTYLARQIAKSILQPQLNVLKHLRMEDYLHFLTFHQSYGYEEFVEGLRPSVDEKSGALRYEIFDGLFKEICLSAQRDRNKGLKHILIIDEINRGNISKIFGELITLLEECKRDGRPEALSVRLPYSKQAFTVPDNLYIIGTMNTADRSIALLDIALRRRFTFKACYPKPELLLTSCGPIDLSAFLSVLNTRIEDYFDKDHTIGHSYFLNLQDYDAFVTCFKRQIFPLLEEYFYNDYEKIASILNQPLDEGNASSLVLKRHGINGAVYYPGPALMDDSTVDPTLFQRVYA